MSGADILFSIPWHCGEHDCPVGWHLGTYWIEWDDAKKGKKKTEYTYDAYSDGDHETGLTDKDLPSCEEQIKAWREYYQSVADSGVDPLSQFMLPTAPKKPHQWQACFRAKILEYKEKAWDKVPALTGLLCTGVRRRSRGDWIQPTDAPKFIQEYLMLQSAPFPLRNNRKYVAMVCTDFKTGKELIEAVGKANVTQRGIGGSELWVTFTVDEEPTPWSDERLAAFLRKAARKALSENK